MEKAKVKKLWEPRDKEDTAPRSSPHSSSTFAIATAVILLQELVAVALKRDLVHVAAGDRRYKL